MKSIVLTAVLMIPASAWAEDPVDGGAVDPSDHAPITNRINLRVGGASTDTTGYPTICMDVRIAFRIGVEACGTGQALLHDEPGNEMAHFRVNYSILDRSLWKGTLHARAGVGFAELQLGKDNPGFNFGAPDADRGSVAGPEAALSAQWLLPMYKKLDFVVTGTAGLAYFAGAPELATSKSELQSFVSVEAGVGW